MKIDYDCETNRCYRFTIGAGPATAPSKVEPISGALFIRKGLIKDPKAVVIKINISEEDRCLTSEESSS